MVVLVYFNSKVGETAQKTLEQILQEITQKIIENELNQKTMNKQKFVTFNMKFAI